MRTRAAVAAAIGIVVLLTADPAQAQRDISGTWVAVYHEDQPERGPGPDMVEYQGLPINEAARQRGLSWDASILSLPVHQCRPHPAFPLAFRSRLPWKYGLGHWYRHGKTGVLQGWLRSGFAGTLRGL